MILERFDRSFQRRQEILAALRAGYGDHSTQVMAEHPASVRVDILANREVGTTGLEGGGMIISARRGHATWGVSAASPSISVTFATRGCRTDREAVGNGLP